MPRLGMYSDSLTLRKPRVGLRRVIMGSEVSKQNFLFFALGQRVGGHKGQ